jgi:chromosome segregation ATPase
MVALMDTLSIYEQFRAALGEEKAKVFAQTLGAMIEEAKNAATKDDIRLLRETVDAHAARVDAALARLAEAQVRAEARLAGVEDRLARVEDRLAGVEDRLARVEDRLAGVEDRLDRAEARLAGVEDRLDRAEARLAGVEDRLTRLEQVVEKLAQRMDQLTAVVEKLVIRSDRHEGTLLELKFRDRLPSYLGRYLRRAKVLQPADLLDDIERRLESAEVDDFLRADVLAQGTVNGEPTYLIGEVSYTADAGDVERAARRAGLLRKASLPAVGLVACEAVHPETVAYAREQGVRIWADGVLLAERP